jgi:hypothetical protein
MHGVWTGEMGLSALSLDPVARFLWIKLWILVNHNRHVRNEEMLLRVKKEDILHEISKRKANWIDNILSRNCLLQKVNEARIKGEM